MRKRQREIFHSLVYLPNGHNCQVWVRPKLRNRKSILVFHMGDKDPKAQKFEPSLLDGSRVARIRTNT